MKTTLDELQTFVTVVDCGSISGAAKRNDMTVSATSRTLARLEEKLGTTLLRRTTRRLALTEEGRAYLTRARKIIGDVVEAEEMLAQRRGVPSGLLRVDAATPFMLHVVAPLAMAFQRQYPHIELELNNNDQIIDLLEKRTDVAIRIGRLDDSTLRAAPIGSSQIRVVASPEYIKNYGEPKTIEELKQHKLLGFSSLEKLNDWPLIDEDGELLHIRSSLRASSGETLRRMLLQGGGIACLSDFMTQADRKAGRLITLFDECTQELRQPINAVYYRNSGVSMRVTRFIEFLQEHVKQYGFE